MRIYIGWDPREEVAYRVAAHSAHRLSPPDAPVAVHPVILSDLRRRGLYTRGLIRHGAGKLADAVNGAPMSTEFAITRFFLPHLAGRQGWALFCDCDVLFRRAPAELFALRDTQYAVQVVKHRQAVKPGEMKMDGQVQTEYPRKNWSSVVLWNLEHPAHDRLTIDTLNRRTGLELHGFCWLKDEEIGELPPAWNWLEGYSEPIPEPGPALVHLTRGGPWMKGWEGVDYGIEWLAEAGRMSLSRVAA